jgi:L-aspartate oxidase
MDSVPIADASAERPVIIGGGIAGLMTALHLAPQPVMVLTKAPLGLMAASAWAQGGIAAALGADDDPELHAADTIAAGAGLSDPSTVARVTRAAPAAVAELAQQGVRFDRGADGGFSLGLEAAHCRRRIVHAGGDGTGREIMRALADAARRTPSIAILEGVEARRLIVEDGRVAGVLALGQGGPLVLPAARVVIATGGVGGLYRHTTNPLGALGQGLALAARAGAELADVEFVQFHPTALNVGLSPMPLVSEAVRGEGAVLVDDRGERLMAEYPRRDLEPRDVVARAVWRAMDSGRRVLLDAREALGPRFAERFPAIAAQCQAARIDPAVMPIPVRPATHYHMGGIAVDGAGRASIEGLWACGEAAATGLHGANRLASNSLLEAVVGARWVAKSIAGTSARRAAPLGRQPISARAGDVDAVREVMSRSVGVLRDGAGLSSAVEALQPLASGDSAAADAALVGLMIATAALVRTESRGSHCRTDFPRQLPEARRLSLRASVDEVVCRWMPVVPGAAATAPKLARKG